MSERITLEVIASHWKAVATIVTILVGFLVATAQYGHRVVEIWNITESNTDMRNSLNTLKTTVKSIQEEQNRLGRLQDTVENLHQSVERMTDRFDEIVRIEERSKSPCTVFLAHSHSMEETSPGKTGRLTISFRTIRSDCTIVPPIRVNITDSSNTTYSAKVLFSGATYDVGTHTITYRIEVPKETELGLASVWVEKVYNSTTGFDNQQFIRSPEIPFLIVQGSE